MIRKLTVLLLVGLLISLFGCNKHQNKQEDILSEMIVIYEIEIEKINNTDEDKCRTPEESIITNSEHLENNIVESQEKFFEPVVIIISQNDTTKNNSSEENKIVTSQNLDVTSKTTAPIQEEKPTPISQPIPESNPIPQPLPEPLPMPEPSPQQPPSVVVEPLPARTICNICETDITGNIAAHGTVYLLNGENFSYRVE